MSELGMDYFLNDQSMVDRYRADTRALLDEPAFEKAWAEGRQMSYEQLLDYV
jgi:hypothetical protein